MVLGVFAPAIRAGAQSPAAEPRASFDSAWAAIARSYWDTLFIARQWRPVADSLRAALDPNADDDAVRAAIRAMIAVPRQSHFVLIPGSAVPLAPGTPESQDGPTRPGTLGLDVRTIDGAVVAWRVDVDGPAARAGVRAGDAITHVDTVPLDSARERLRAATPAGNEAADRLLTAAVKSRLGGAVGDSRRLTVVGRNGRPRVLTLTRVPMTGRLTQFGNLPPFVVTVTRDSVPIGRRRTRRYAAVIGFSAWFPAIVPELDEMLFTARDAPGLILDLRGNPGGVVGMVAGVAGHFLDSTVSLGELHGRGANLRFAANPRLVDRHGTLVNTFSGPIAILVDDFTASTSEFFSSGMQAIGRARIFGGRTAGQALPALMARLPNGDVLMHVIAEHEDPIGRRVEGNGVVPDEVVPLRRSDLRAGRDAALEAARAWLTSLTP